MMLTNALSSAQDGMLRASASVAERAEAIVAPGGVTPQNAVGLVSDSTSFEANAAVARTTDRMMGTLLDVLA